MTKPEAEPCTPEATSQNNGAALGEGGPAQEEGPLGRGSARTPLAHLRHLQVKPLSTLVDWFELDGFSRARREGRGLLARPASSRISGNRMPLPLGAASLSWRRIGAAGKMAVVP